MPVDLLGYLIEAPASTTGWIWVVSAMIAGVIGWYVGVFWWTVPGRGSNPPAVVATARAALTRRRALRSIATIRSRYRTGVLTATAAAAEISAQLRLFLSDVTGAPAEYLQVPDFGGALAPAVPIMTDLADLQFNRYTVVDVDTVAGAADELVRRWS